MFTADFQSAMNRTLDDFESKNGILLIKDLAKVWRTSELGR